MHPQFDNRLSWQKCGHGNLVSGAVCCMDIAGMLFGGWIMVYELHNLSCF